jgi:oligoendopeptidase F
MIRSIADTPFVPADFDPSRFSAIEPLGRALIDRPLDTADDVRRWLSDLSDLSEIIYEYGSRKNIDNACHTDDVVKEKAYLHWLTEIQPRLKPLFFELQKKFLASPAHREQDDPERALLLRDWRVDVELFRPENVPLQTREDELGQEYGKIMGAMTVEFRGKTQTLQQLGRYLEETDRPTREAAWTLSAGRRLQDRRRLDEIFDELVQLRQQMARNAGLPDFRAYMWQAKKRFDYSPEDCLAFGRAVETACVPINAELDRRRQAALGVDRLRPWDTAVDVKGRLPLRPFAPEKVEDMVAGVREIFRRLAPELADAFWSLHERGDLDLDSRPGKRPGGFQAALEASRRPFIFMNAAGVHVDVETLLHEGGHAFHYLDARRIPNVFLRHAPLEFCEVASMSMELLGCDHFDVFYPDRESAGRAKRSHLEGIVRSLPWIATIDGFQHWLYAHPDHTADERIAAWLDLLRRFGTGVTDWSGWEEARATLWHRQLHLFEVPFYYIEYGIAQLGALMVWTNYRQDPRSTLSALREAFALGGTRPLPDLFRAAGLEFDFSPDTLGRLLQAVRDELAGLPE